VTKLNPKKVLLVHGDQPAMNWFSQTLGASLPGTEVIAPEPKEEIALW